MTSETVTLEQILTGDALARIDERPETVDRLLLAADDHGVAALVWEALAGAGGGGKTLRDRLAVRVQAAAARDLIAQRELQSVLATLAAAGVPALVIKGSALAYTVYDHPWLRPRTDTDVLIRSADIAAASRALEGCGYRRSDAVTSGELVSHQAAFERTDRHDVHHVLDLHWKLVNPQMLADVLSFDELWRDAVPAPALGTTARVPSLPASIIIGSVHRLAHHQGHDRLIWLVDFLRLAARCDEGEWASLVRLGRASRVSGLCLDGLTQARIRLGATFPEHVERALGRDAPSEPSRIYLERAIRKRDVLVRDLRMLPSWRTRLTLLREHVFPPAAFIRHRYRGHPRWPLPALYLHRLVTGAIRWVRP